MTDLSQFDPTGRFTGLAEKYARHRPGYPREALDFIRERCRFAPDSLLVDVGSGTGILSRQLASLGYQVIGIEPNAEMRRQAEAARQPGHRWPLYREGRAEATSLPDSTADAVLAAQAFHWFEPEPTLREFHRILKPAGWVVLLWNERDETDPFTAACGEVMRTAAETVACERFRQGSAELLRRSPLFLAAEPVCFAHQQFLDEEGLIGRSLSVSYAPRAAEEIEPFVNRLQQVFHRFQQEGRVVLRYQTTVVLARRQRPQLDACATHSL